MDHLSGIQEDLLRNDFTGLPTTFELAFYAILIAIFIGILSGVTAAVKRNTSLDYIPMTIAMIGSVCQHFF
ncbi:MAG: hypothetical protein CM15mP127_09170 [Gammaproteobacteria bacterium]|nr:MAG: hypothetical protein CM15mP127_09170 [Gammaproteobacteria bacterium]